jgi:hypothetical protein
MSAATFRVNWIGITRRTDDKTEAPSRDQVTVCREWLRTQVMPRKTINKRMSSYGLKHRVEDWTSRSSGTCSRKYVTNGAFIVAAQLEGYRVESIGDGPNAWINFALRKSEP